MAITVIGCIFCMMHLLPAALATTAVINTAFVVFFASTNINTFVATAIDVLLVSIAMLVILKTQYADFTRLVKLQAPTAKFSEETFTWPTRTASPGWPTGGSSFPVSIRC